MSDFLKRMAARVIGGEAALAPRLPSLFEPSQRAPTLPSTDAGEAPSRGRDAVAATSAVPAGAPVAPMNATSPAGRSRTPITSVDPPRMSKPAPAAAHPPSDTLAASAHRPAQLLPPTVEPLAAMFAPEHSAATGPASPVSPRQTRIAPARQAAASQSAAGILRPELGPVFGTLRAGPSPASSGHGAARRAPLTPAGSENGASTETVVHVSIGRLEVRAAAAAVAAPRRRDEPRPSSLDDYLRQRGDKVLP